MFMEILALTLSYFSTGCNNQLKTKHNMCLKELQTSNTKNDQLENDLNKCDNEKTECSNLYNECEKRKQEVIEEIIGINKNHTDKIKNMSANYKEEINLMDISYNECEKAKKKIIADLSKCNLEKNDCSIKSPEPIIKKPSKPKTRSCSRN